MLFKVKNEQKNNADYIILTEMLFILLPLIIVLLYKLSKNNVCSIFDTADWSYCTVLFSGQCIIKLVSALLKKHNEYFRWQFVALWLAIVIVLFLVPAVIFICLMQEDNVKRWVKIAQIIWFGISVFGYFQIAGYAQEKEEQRDQ